MLQVHSREGFSGDIGGCHCWQLARSRSFCPGSTRKIGLISEAAEWGLENCHGKQKCVELVSDYEAASKWGAPCFANAHPSAIRKIKDSLIFHTYNISPQYFFSALQQIQLHPHPNSNRLFIPDISTRYLYFWSPLLFLSLPIIDLLEMNI